MKHGVRLFSLVWIFFVSIEAGPREYLFEPLAGFLDNQKYVTGYIYTRGIVRDSAGNAVYVEYDENGEEVSEIGPATGELSDTSKKDSH